MYTCIHASSGCNYPEGECAGLCHQAAGGTKTNASPKAVLSISVQNGRLCGASPREGMRELRNGIYELVLKGKKQ